MSAAMATMYGALVAGKDRRRRAGEVSAESRGWIEEPGGEIVRPSGGGERRFQLRCFNDRDLNLALWDVRVEYYKGGTLLGYLTPETPAAYLVEPIDLESRKSVYRFFWISTGGRELERLMSADRLELVATLMPDGVEMRATLPTWNDVDREPA